jgi:hypothetical protein
LISGEFDLVFMGCSLGKKPLSRRCDREIAITKPAVSNLVALSAPLLFD